MEIGRVKDTIKERAILKRIKKCQKVQEQPSEIFTISDTISAPVWLLREYKSSYIKVQIEDILERLSIEFAEPIMMTGIIMLPEQTEETCLRFLIDCLAQTAAERQIEISDIQAECSPDVINALLLLTVFGKRSSERLPLHGAEAFLPGKEIVMVGTAALEGTIMLESAGRKALEQRFSKRFLENVKSLSSKIEIRNKIKVIQEIEDAGVYFIGRTGVFGTLWEIASVTGKGFLVTLKDIPIYQETIEICEFFDINPYMLRSGGALLVAAKQGKILVDRYRACGIEAAVIGRMEDNADKLVCNGEERRYLTMPTAVKLGQNQPEGLNWIY